MKNNDIKEYPEDDYADYEAPPSPEEVIADLRRQVDKLSLELRLLQDERQIAGEMLTTGDAVNEATQIMVDKFKSYCPTTSVRLSISNRHANFPLLAVPDPVHVEFDMVLQNGKPVIISREVSLQF